MPDVSDVQVTVVIPTLSADSRLLDCLLSLEKQTFRSFEATIVDNSGRGLVRRGPAAGHAAHILEQERNVGFGAAINAAIGKSRARYVATLNDDALAHPRWLEALVAALDANPKAGMCASQVRLFGENQLDSAGMLIAGDGSSKQRGHLYPPEDFNQPADVLCPSGSAALYRRAMLDEVGAFDTDFFLYCEDTDLGLRARRAGWTCVYEPAAVVEHHYSHSAGRASRLKAYYVERNRLFLLLKNFPGAMLAAAPFVTMARYWWHLRSLCSGRGAAAHFRQEGNSTFDLVFTVIRAHLSLLANARALWRKRCEISRTARLAPGEFARLLRRHSIRVRQVAEL